MSTGDVISVRGSTRRHSGESSVPESGRIVTERAKGLLMLRHGVNSHHAFALLIRLAQNSGTDIATTAQRLLDDYTHDGDTRAAQIRALATKRLFGVGLLLQGTLRLAGRPELHRRLQNAIDEIDRTIAELRAALIGLPD